MIIIRSAERLASYLEKSTREGRSIGFVPTMGALHEGHLALIRRALDETDLAVASVFVNPTQFNDPRDFEKYPVTVEKDIAMLEAAGCDILFLPSVTEIYPSGTQSARSYDLGYLETILEGAHRPGHFQGVCQVVDRLLEITNPHKLFMGRKDYQQCMVISRLLELTGRNTRLVTCDTIREPDGLAMSSRNQRLDPVQRQAALAISRELLRIREQLAPGDLDGLKANSTAALEADGFVVDYVEICHAKTLEPQHHWDGYTPLVALVAAFLGQVRLIDNMPIASGGE